MQRHPHLVPLSHQHHDALLLCVLVERSLRADSGAANLARQAAKVVHFSATEGENHFGLEEEILFPLVESALGGHPLLEVLRAEHAELRALSALLESEPTSEHLQAFTALLRSHVRKEEKDFFEDVQARLPEEVFAEAAAQIRARAIQVCVTG